MEYTSLPAMLLLLLGSLLGATVAWMSAFDTFIEFFTGVIDEESGILVPKTALSRYILPPHSLLFNIALNPALHRANEALRPLVWADNPHHLFRALIWLQPFLQHGESFFAPGIRRMMRRNNDVFRSMPVLSRVGSSSLLLRASTYIGRGSITQTYQLSQPTVAVASNGPPAGTELKSSPTAIKAAATLARQASLANMKRK